MASKRKRKRRRWDNHEDHPFVVVLTDELAALGYEFLGYDDDVDGTSWRRPLSGGYFAEVDIIPQPALSRGFIGFTSCLFVMSQRHTDVWNTVAPWGCDVSGSLLPQGPRKDPTPILMVSFPWLISHWEPTAGSMLEASKRWEAIASGNAPYWTSDFAVFMKVQGEKYFALLRDAQALAETLQYLPEFPGRTARGGPMSTDPAVFAAVILHDLGDRVQRS